jgi:TolB-like protein/DNA-binding winged helix-turn-helix (wHTH) protein/Tfp pilus assembly protein PilF
VACPTKEPRSRDKESRSRDKSRVRATFELQTGPMQVSFGEFVLDLDSRELRRGAGPVRLSPKALQLLEILVINRPKALSKADLQDKLWPDTFVVDKNLANLVSEIRQALGDNPSAPGFIRTVPRYGYAFHETMPGVQESPVARPPAPARRRAALALGAVALLVIAGFAAVFLDVGRPGAPARIMLAVLPFQNLTGDPDQEYLCDGLTEEMIAQLGGLQPSRLAVIARTSAIQYKNTAKRADEIGRELGVDFLLESSIRRTGDRIRIAAQLIDVGSQTHIWAEQSDHEMRDIVQLQRDIAAAITRRILASFALEQRPDPGTPRHSSNALAYEQYMRGRWHWAKDTPEGLQKGKDHFLKAIALDPAYALAYSGLADSYALLGSYNIMPISDSHPLGRDAALKALSLNESLGQAHSSLAAILADYYWEWTEAERHFKRAIELEPNDVSALHFYSFYLALTGRSAEALPIAQRAIRIDPLSLRAQVNLGVVWNMARRYDDAVSQFERTLDLDSGYAMTHAMLGLTYAYKSMPERAVAELVLARQAGGNRPDLIALHGYALARAGHTDEALATIDELHRLSKPRDPSAYLIAIVYVGVGDKNRAFEWLQKAVDARAWELPALKADTLFDPIRSDPRFAPLLDRLGLPR